MARQSRFTSSPSTTGVGRDTTFGRYLRLPGSLQVFSFSAALAFVVVVVIAPTNAPTASAAVGTSAPVKVQSLSVNGQFVAQTGRDGYTVTKPIPVAPPVAKVPVGPLAAAVPAGEAQQIAYGMLQARGWGDSEFSCLVSLWNRESHWTTTAGNASGAYGIPQALPGSKMASAGPNWQTDATTQITWGLGYISGRYGTPCGAWAHSQSSGWY